MISEEGVEWPQKQGQGQNFKDARGENFWFFEMRAAHMIGVLSQEEIMVAKQQVWLQPASETAKFRWFEPIKRGGRDGTRTVWVVLVYGNDSRITSKLLRST
jgi:hypothetical protein